MLRGSDQDSAKLLVILTALTEIKYFNFSQREQISETSKAKWVIRRIYATSINHPEPEPSNKFNTAKMFVNFVNRRTKVVTSRPVSLSSIPEAPEDSDSASMSRSSSSRSSFMKHQNDSEATLVNDILILHIAKESKTPSQEELHPLFASPERYRDSQVMESPPLTPSMPSSPSTVASNRSSACYSNRSSGCYSSVASSADTTRDGPRDRYSTKSIIKEELHWKIRELLSQDF